VTKFRALVIITTLAWLVITGACVYVYVANRLRLLGIEGFEAESGWQLMLFVLTRLPFLVVALAVAIILEWRFLR
jgi:hypothetical protein